MTEPKRICKRCLLSDMPDEAALVKSIQELIALLPEDKRTPAAQAARRLSICRTCDHLQNGMCALCGCYVEFRTAKIHMRCPHVPSKW